MNVFLVRGDPDFCYIRPTDNETWHWRSGVPVPLPWLEPSLTVSSESSNEEFLAVDCLPMDTGADGPIISDFARQVLELLLSPVGEFWPVRVLDRRYWWFNCLSCVNALDRAYTDAEWESVSGHWGEFRWITTVRRLAFRPTVAAQGSSLLGLRTL